MQNQQVFHCTLHGVYLLNEGGPRHAAVVLAACEAMVALGPPPCTALPGCEARADVGVVRGAADWRCYTVVLNAIA